MFHSIVVAVTKDQVIPVVDISRSLVVVMGFQPLVGMGK